MPLEIPLQTLSNTGYIQLGQNGYYASGFITITNGNVDVIVNQTNSRGSPSVGISGPVLSPNLTPGQYTFSKGEGTFITGIQVRPSKGTLSAPAQTVQGMLYEPTSAFIIPIASNNQTNNIQTAMIQIGNVIVSAPTTTINFTGIPQTYNHLTCIFNVASTTVAVSDSLIFTVNNDTANTYYSEALLGDTNTASAVMQGPIAFGIAAVVPAASSPGGNVWAVGDILLPSYSVGITHAFRSAFYSPYNLGTAQRSAVYGGSHQVGAAINSLQFSMSSTATFANFSQITLYALT